MSKYKQDLEKRVIESKKDSESLNSLIRDFKPFIASVAQKKVGRYLEYGKDDELSVGLLAFREAVDSFDLKKGKFLSFARMVISLRLIDHFRKNKKSDKNIRLDGPGDEIFDRQSIDRYREDNKKEERKEEVIRYSAMLSEWGISLNDLVKASPKQERLKKTYQSVAKKISEDKELLDSFLKSKRLPVKQIQKVVLIHRNKLERGRIYIIGMVLAIISGLSYLNINKT